MRICILGAGTWGTALAALLVNNGHDTVLWSAIPSEVQTLSDTHTHPHLPGAHIPEALRLETDIAAACRDAQLVLFVVASEYIRTTAAKAAPYLSDGVILVSAAKGLERGTLLTMTDIIEEETAKARPALPFTAAALSGPTHAEEVALGLPTSIVAACTKETVAGTIADIFKNSCMRVYTNTDVTGVELSGALKNIVAIAAGICRGMGLGDNALAMLMTRGAAEITRMGLAMGCRRETFMGLSGIGDLIVTCTSRHSRNNRCGELIGKGFTYAQAAAEIGMVVEGYHALEAAMSLRQTYQVPMPITEAVFDVLCRGTSPQDAMKRLMQRDIKNELTDAPHGKEPTSPSGGR